MALPTDTFWGKIRTLLGIASIVRNLVSEIFGTGNPGK